MRHSDINDEDDFSEKKDLERLNLLLRLKLLSSIEGESTELAIDFFGKKSPTLYLVEDARDAFPLDLTFDAFVECFEKFGGNHRWYLAFLDKAAEKLNADGVPTPAGGKWHATQVIRVRERLSQRA